MDTRKAKYRAQKYNALRRKIGWIISYEDWCRVWDNSEKWDQRGRHAGGFVMARNNDQGPYSVDNVSIKSLSENRKDDWQQRKAKRDPFRTEPRDHLPPNEAAWYYPHENLDKWLDVYRQTVV